MRLTVIFILSFFLFSGFFIDINDGKKHLITVNHPAFGKDDQTEFFIHELRRDSSTLEGYFLDAESVICVDHSCKIVPVRMFWDPLGNYLKYELSDGIILEKKEGKPFLPEDYDRLHEILQDKSSPYSGLSYYEITHEKVVGEGDVDGMTGATAILLDETKTVLGGAWTCYTLWHWAHGDAVQEIQRVSGTAANTKELLAHLASANNKQELFALNEIIKRKDFDSNILTPVVGLAQHEARDYKIFRKVLTYLELANAEIYYQQIKQLLENNLKDRRKILWNSIMKSHKNPPANYFDSFFEKIIESSDYHEINLFLNILEQKKATSASLTEQMIPLLKEEFSIINRRIYWFLEQQELTNSQSKVLHSYFQQYSDYL